jgi:AraC-like DNA-binding protein
MKHRQPDMHAPREADLGKLQALPRPIYGHFLGLPNRAIRQRHSHPWGQLSYAMSGVIEVRTANARFMAPPLRAIWIPAGLSHSVHCRESTQIRSLYIDPVAIPADSRECRVLVVTPLIRELILAFSELPVEYDEQGADGRLAGVLIDQLARAPEAALSLPWPQDTRLRRLCNDLLKNPGSRISLSSYGRKLHLSERSLSRLLLQQTGLSFRLWRQRARLLGSLPLLERGDRVTDVALACGYDSMSAFIAAFREQMGMTPREFSARL